MIIDLLFAAAVMYGFYLGYSKQPLHWLTPWFSTILGALMSIYLAPVIYDKIATWWGSDSWILLFFVVLSVFWICKRFVVFLGGDVQAGSKKVGIKFPEKLTQGIMLSFIFGLLISAVLIFSIDANIISQKQSESSISYPVAVYLPKKTVEVLGHVKPGVNRFYSKTHEVIGK